MKWLRAAGWVAGLALSFAPGRLAGQISPGPLARAHHALEGALKCTECHAGGKKALSSQCTNCHRDIAWLADRRLGFHGREARGGECASCHPDHAGEGFALVQWPEGSPERFAHGRTGWELEGSHREVPCTKCHAEQFRISPAARLSARKAPGGWIGLDRACASCHTDVHRGALGSDCTKCHDAGKWKMTPGFDHSRTRYPLDGEHTTVACDKCHLDARVATQRDSTGHLIPVFRPLPHDQCSDCHRDPHAGRLGPECARCHTTRGFSTIERDRFDHDRTRYPLRGRHVSVACAGCHDFRKPEGKKPPFATCTACHADAHGGTATLAGKVVDCAACHSVDGFMPATFTAAQHQATRYPLDGKHRTARCSACHGKESGTAASRWGTSRIVIRPAFAACRSCHGEDHGSQLAGRTGGGDCADCHAVAGWTPSRFDRAAHAKLRLPLDGRHGEIPCSACHAANRPGLPPVTLTAATLGRAKVVLQVSEIECSSCHLDPHRGRFASAGPQGKAWGCPACHTAAAFRPSTVDVAAHANYGFPLGGAHRAVPCLVCHKEMKAAGGKRSSLVAGGATIAPETFDASGVCADCHQNPHGDQFARERGGARCDRCHGDDAFAPASRFDHDRDASFALKGAHEKVPCGRCHAAGPAGTGPIYRPVSGRCESCHGERRGT